MSKKITINQFEKIVGNPEGDKVIEYNGIDGEIYEITIHPFLGVSEVMSFVEDVASTVVNEDSEVYIPELLDFAIRRAILTHYADFPMSASIEKEYRLVQQSAALAEEITKHVHQTQFEEMINAVSSTIHFRKQKLNSITRQRLMEEAERLNEINTKIELAMDLPSIQELVGEFEQMDPESLIKTLTDHAGNISAIESGDEK